MRYLDIGLAPWSEREGIECALDEQKANANVAIQLVNVKGDNAEDYIIIIDNLLPFTA